MAYESFLIPQISGFIGLATVYHSDRWVCIDRMTEFVGRDILRRRGKPQPHFFMTIWSACAVSRPSLLLMKSVLSLE